ncbi:hypothetical protein [Cystobacter fuscus]|uniref:hypothetical protein n=1 Tax=Cystobacter fuscus TaxID=43 RepID=UPI002B2E0615|nr:hypothetical protein F0U63_01245 [Cystobacter fuscus]
MGWIRERMAQLEPPSTSLSELAQRVRKAHAWPRGKKLKAASLATYLGKFDGGEQLEWLDQHPEVSRALAEALEMAPEEMDEQLAERQANKPAPGSKLRLRDVQTRPLDLMHEPLPPGIRVEVQDPAFWPLWWYAPSGSGRTLVGHWLQARGLAVFIQARTWAEAEQQFPDNGHPVFVELDSAEEAPDWEQRWEGWKICVATESLPSAPPIENRPEEEEHPFREPPPNWRLVKNASASEWIDDFLEWLEERVTMKRFNAKAFRQWLSQSTILNRIDNVGTALGLAGLFATYDRNDGTTGPLSRTQELSELAKLFLRMLIQHREHEVDLSVPKLWERLLHLSHSLLQDDSAPSHEARPLDAWHALVRVRPDRVDLEWLEKLVEDGLKMDKAHIDKARTHLPADAFRTVKALRSLGLLRERQPGQYAFRPPWVLEALLQHTLLALFEQGPEAWGGVLLRQEHAVTVFEELFKRCRNKDFTLVEQLLARPAPASSAWVAGLEASFRALGFASLMGVQFPEALRRDILRHQRALIIPTHDGIPLPRITYAYKSEQEEPLLDRGLWYAALFSLTEALPPHSELSIEDWCAGIPEQARIWLLNMAACRTAREKGVRSDWWTPLLDLGGRLMNRLQLFNDSASWVPELVQPEYLLRRFQRKDLTLRELDQYFTWREISTVLPDYVQRRGLAWEELARVIWDVWIKERNDKQLPQFLAPDAPHAQLFWKTPPAAAIEILVEDRFYHSMFRQESVFSFFQCEHWDVFLRSWTSSGGISRAKTGYSQLTALQKMPEEHVRQAIRAGYPDAYDHSSRRLLWRLWPEVLCEEVGRMLQQAQWETALHQAWAAPANLVPRLLASAEQGMTRPSTPPSPMLARWLHGQIGERVPGWDKAWMLLERLMPSTKQ